MPTSSQPPHPALNRLAARLAESPVRFGPVRIASVAGQTELRHVDDHGRDASGLRELPVSALRELATADSRGAFRPNKGAPNLVAGWVCRPADPAALDEALDALVPGALADWHAAEDPALRIVTYREFADRQTGMYRNTASLSDPEACEVARACCDARFCLRRRLWSVGLLEPDTVASKSDAACLEPCALLLELARRAHRMSQEERSTLHLGETDLASVSAALDIAIAHPPEDLREGDLANPAHPRRLLLLKEKILPWLPAPERGKVE